MREANPAIVFCAITGYGQDGPYAAARRPRHELPRPGRAARPDRRQGRPAGPVRRPDRRPRRRRPDGRLRGDGGAARAPALRRGADGRRLDGRRRPLLAGDGRRPLLLRRRGAAARRAAARRRPRSVTCPTRPPTAGSAAAPWSRSSGPPSATASSVPTWSRSSSRRPGSDGLARGRRGLPLPHPRRVERLQRRARLLHRAGPRPRRGARLGAGPGARDGGRDGAARASARSASSASR